MRKSTSNNTSEFIRGEEPPSDYETYRFVPLEDQAEYIGKKRIILGTSFICFLLTGAMILLGLLNKIPVIDNILNYSLLYYIVFLSFFAVAFMSYRTRGRGAAGILVFLTVITTGLHLYLCAITIYQIYRCIAVIACGGTLYTHFVVILITGSTTLLLLWMLYACITILYYINQSFVMENKKALKQRKSYNNNNNNTGYSPYENRPPPPSSSSSSYPGGYAQDNK